MFFFFFWFHSTFSSLFLYRFLTQIFYPNFYMIFPKMVEGGGVFIGKMRNGRLALVYPSTPMSAPSLSTMSSTLLAFFFLGLFYDFWPDLLTAVWRPSQAPFSSNLICTGILGCLVSNGSSLVQFGATIVEISCLEWKWCKAE